MKCLLDMDGVLADFTGGIFNRVRGVPEPKELTWDHVRDNEWGLLGLDFWLRLALMPAAKDIYWAAIKTFGVSNVGVLSSPVMTPGCVEGKKAWLSQHFPSLATGHIFFGSRKEFFAHPDILLVDDRDENVDNFLAAGGAALLVPAKWNRRKGEQAAVAVEEIRAYAR